ncbi:MAG TPA: hypothetical protein VHU81_11915 [Thermoanaerobaculia bacterium]|nr:hypothetical protein [Thermoanaerobaculia bacterium]
MDILKAGPLQAVLERDLLLLLKDLTDLLGSRQAALKTLRGFLAGQGGDDVVEPLLSSLGIDREFLEERFDKYKDLLDLVLGPIGNVGDRPPVELPLKTQGAADLAGGAIALEGSAELTAAVEADNDGSALDGRISFQAGDEVVIRVGLAGALAGKLDAAGNLGGVAGTGGFQAGGRFTLDNYYRHARAEPVLDALLADLTDFTLPGKIDDPKDLRSQAAAGGLRTPNQWVHLQAEGNLSLAGSLRWSQSSVQVGDFDAGGLHLDDALTVTTGLQAAVTFQHQISGLFDLLVSAAPDPSKVRVELHKNRKVETEIGVEVGATVGIQGVDTVAKAVLDTFLPKVTALVDQAEAKAAAFPTVRSLFAAKLSGSLDALLGGQKFISEAESLLKTVGKDVDLAAQLKEIATEAATDFADEWLQKIDQNIDKLRGALADIIRKYRATLDKLNAALAKAADIQIAVTLAQKRQRSAESDALLVFDIDPRAQPAVLRHMLLGRFDDALRLAAAKSDDVKLQSGVLTEGGSLQVTSSLNISAAGLSINHAAVLRQSWTTEISLQGDVNLNAVSSLTGTLTVFGRSRTMTFLASGSVVGKVGRLPGLEDLKADHQASLELTEERPVKAKDLDDLGKALAGLGVISGPPSLATRLSLLSGDPAPSGRLALTALLPLGTAELDLIAQADPPRARLIFARALNDFIFLAAPFNALDTGNGLPLVLWPTVNAHFESELAEHSNEAKHLLPLDSQGKIPPAWNSFDPNLLRTLRVQWNHVRAFTATLQQLLALRLTFQGLDARQATLQMRQRQRGLLKASGSLVQGEALDSRINYVFFKALARLAHPGADLGSFAVLEYKDRKFVLS